VSVFALVVLFLLAAATLVLVPRGEPDFVYARPGVPRPASSGALSIVIVAGMSAALGLAALLALNSTELDDTLAVLAVLAGGVAGVLGGGPLAVAVLDLADPTTGPPDGVPLPDPPPVAPSVGAVPPPPLVPPGPPVPGTAGSDPGSIPTQPVATAGAATMATVPAGPADPRLLRGGLWIGVLERGAVVGAVLTGFTEGVALLLVVKGFGRYPELHSPPAAERFIIGTLVSILWACTCAGVTFALIR
jgi:hypothetical protein